jgi:hypothetical protein
MQVTKQYETKQSMIGNKNLEVLWIFTNLLCEGSCNVKHHAPIYMFIIITIFCLPLVEVITLNVVCQHCTYKYRYWNKRQYYWMIRGGSCESYMCTYWYGEETY